MREWLERPWSVGVCFRGFVQYAVPWERTDDALWFERVFDDEVTVYLVDSSLPPPPANGAWVDPEALQWVEVVRHVVSPGVAEPA